MVLYQYRLPLFYVITFIIDLLLILFFVLFKQKNKDGEFLILHTYPFYGILLQELYNPSKSILKHA